MSTIRIDILNERAMTLIRYLESVGDVRIRQGHEYYSVEETLPEYSAAESPVTRRDWYGILADHPNKDDTLNHFDKLRNEWDDRY